MEAKTIIAVIVAGVSYMAINKWIWTPMKRGPKPIQKEDDDPPSVPSSSAEFPSSSSPPPPERKDDPASLPSSSAEVSILEVNQESVDLDPSVSLLSSAESSSAPMLEIPEPISEVNQESVDLDPSTSLLSLAESSSSASMRENPEPISEVNQESVDLDPSASLLSSAESSSAPMLENPEPKSGVNQESVDLDPSTSLLSLAESSSSASMLEKPEPISEVNQESVDVDPSVTLLSSAESSSAPLLENPELISEVNQESVDLDPSTSLLSSAPLQRYDVFLSFRGTDTRTDFLSHLYHELKIVRGIETFKDDRELEIGDPICATLLKAIEESKCAIVVLSKRYAESPWCLEELAKICQCMKDNNRILPIFYHVEPTEVRFQTGCFKDAFTKHENLKRQSSENIKGWREACERVAGFSGCNTEDHKDEREVVEHIVESVCSKVRPIEIEFIISSRDFEPFKATREAMDNVMKTLKDEKVTAVGVYGMGGIGKTTMVEHVGVEAQKKGLFRQVIMAGISQKPKLRENTKPDFWDIQGRLAYMLGGSKLEVDEEFARACTLRKRILSKDRILIILDNIWNEIELTSIGIPTYDELKRRNSKVLLTTRRLEVCHLMDCDKSIPLNALAEDDSWKLFVKIARKSFETPTNFYDIAVEVAKECAGLPVALIAVAKALRGKKFNQWVEAARRLKESKPPNAEDEGRVFECIKLSYDYLKSDDSKLCFLLCCLFPEDYDIQIEDLLKYGIGKGLFQEDDMRVARATIHSLVESLKDSSLLLDGKRDRGCVRMHDVIRDVAISISLSKDGHPRFFVKAGCELESWPRIDAHGCYNAISLIKNKIHMLPKDLVCSELQILLLQSNVYKEIPEFFFQSLQALRVLDLSQTSISLLPLSFNLLISLHTLCLNRCLSMTSDMSPLGRLRKLEILSMRELPLKKLPKVVGQLTKLRVLDFTSESVDIVPSNVIGNLSELEELYMQCNFADWGSIVEGNEAEEARQEANPFFDELTSLLNLHNLKVFISDPNCLPTKVEVKQIKWKNFDICIGRDPSIRELSLDPSSSPDSKALTLDTTMDTLPKWFIEVVTEKIEKLQYRNCRGLGNLLKEYYQGSLRALKYLHVIGPSEKLVQLMTPITPVRNEHVFENLEELHLDKVNCLEKLCVGELPTGSLCNLRLLKVRRCHTLMNALLQSNLLQRLQNLEKLSCEVMDELEYVFSSEGSELKQSTLTTLIEMRLENLGKLIKIWNGPAPHKIFCHVKILVVFECNKLKNLFTSDVAHHLYDLEDLSVEACRGLERVIEASEETMSKKIVLKNLKKLALKKLLKLTRFYGSTGSATNDEENIEFPLLEHSHVERCHIFKSPVKDKLVSVMNKQPVLIPMQETGQRETPTLSRGR